MGPRALMAYLGSKVPREKLERRVPEEVRANEVPMEPLGTPAYRVKLDPGEAKDRKASRGISVSEAPMGRKGAWDTWGPLAHGDHPARTGRLGNRERRATLGSLGSLPLTTT